MTARVPIAGDDLRVGDVFLPRVGRRMQVERITLVTRPGYPRQAMLEAHGRTEFANGHISNNWTESYYGHHWVVVERPIDAKAVTDSLWANLAIGEGYPAVLDAVRQALLVGGAK